MDDSKIFMFPDGGTRQTSNDVNSLLPLLIRCEEVLKELNPQFAKDKARDERIAGIETEVAGIKGDIAKILAAVTKQ